MFKKTILILSILLLGLANNAGAYYSLAGKWQYPLAVPWNIDPEFRYGSLYGGQYHLGEDVEAPAETPVYAAANGRVVKTDYSPGYHDWGGLILVEHLNVSGAKVVSLYGHLEPNTFAVSEGQLVQKGQYLGKLADKSRNGGWKPHLHHAIRKGAFVSSPWVYYGFSSYSTLNRWHVPHSYIDDRQDIIDVSRLPMNSPNRYATAAGVSSQRFAASKSVDTVLLATGERFVDAISATALTKSLNAPLLLTRGTSLPIETENELLRVLKPGGKVYIVGGGQAISSSITGKITSLGFKVGRFAGANAAATAAAVASKIAAPTEAFLVSSEIFADGISAGAAAAINDMPILLTKTASLSPETKKYLEDTPFITNVIIVGGNAVVNSSVNSSVKGLGLTTERIAGPNRYWTNRYLNEKYFPQPKALIAATGLDFADALVGGSVAAHIDGTVVLNHRLEVRASMEQYISAVEPYVTRAYVLGGPAALTNSVDLTFGAYLNPGIFTSSVNASQIKSGSTLSEWSQARTAKVEDYTLPVPTGYETYSESFNGADIVGVRPSGNDALGISAINFHGVSDPLKTIANWYGVPEGKVVTQGADPGLLTIQGGFTDSHLLYVQKADDLVVFMAPASDFSADLLLYIENLNN